MSERRVPTFFYGSYMNLDVLAELGLVPGEVEVARLPGFDIRIQPLANLVPSDQHTVYGIVTSLTHAELERLYAHARDVLGGVYLPEPVIVQTVRSRFVPALCYVASSMEPSAPSDDYLDRIVRPAKAHGFPSWYVAKLESFRRGSP